MHIRLTPSERYGIFEAVTLWTAPLTKPPSEGIKHAFRVLRLLIENGVPPKRAAGIMIDEAFEARFDGSD